jgi:hypothetical protein
MTRGLIFTVAVCAWLLCEATVVGQDSGMGGGRGRGGGGGRGSDRQNGDSNFYRGKAPPPLKLLSTPHGGEYVQTDTNRYEIVYLPLQARIYLFDHDAKPLSAREVHARMSLKLPAESAPRQIPFQYVALPAGTAEQDYVVAAFDFQQLPGKETPITFEFSGLPDKHKLLGIWDRHEGTASFTPVFSLAKIRPYVARVLLTEADHDGIMRQTFCPVSGQMLGSKGSIIKLYIADYPLYLSGEDCIAAVNEAPEKYLHPPAGPAPAR